MAREVMVLFAPRAGIAKYGAGLKDAPSTEFAAVVTTEAVRRAGTEPAEVGHVMFGNMIHTDPHDLHLASSRRAGRATGGDTSAHAEPEQGHRLHPRRQGAVRADRTSGRYALVTMCIGAARASPRSSSGSREGTNDMADMTGQVALVTGGARGIGLAISERLAARGVTVAVGYSRNEDAAKQFLDKHGDATIHKGNIGNAEDCQRVTDEVLDQHGKMNILVNNAGITVDKSIRKMTPDDWDRVIRVNLNGAFYLSRAILAHMLSAGYGRIINISSIIGLKGGFGQANYAAAKSGLFGLTMTMALETAKKGITVNTVAPGFTSTEMVAAMPEEALDKIVAQIPVGRLGEPHEVARVVEFLADPDSSYITGQVYSINGGLYM